MDKLLNRSTRITKEKAVKMNYILAVRFPGTSFNGWVNQKVDEELKKQGLDNMSLDQMDQILREQGATA